MTEEYIISTTRIGLQVAIVHSGLRQRDVAARANVSLLDTQQLSELDISKLIHTRKSPTYKQAEALSIVLEQPVCTLFPDLDAKEPNT